MLRCSSWLCAQEGAWGAERTICGAGFERRPAVPKASALISVSYFASSFTYELFQEEKIELLQINFMWPALYLINKLQQRKHV